MALMDRATTSRALIQELGSFGRQKNVFTNSSTTFATAWSLSWETTAAATLRTASQTGDPLMHQDGHIRVWWHCGERTLAACVRLRHTDPSPGVMVRSVIRYTSRSTLVRIDGTLNNARYWCVATRGSTLHSSSAKPHVSAG
ncbi:uncharacterized protein TNCV_2852841 [Trichonephila clavipes]|uniref:Uncharacterized protein n=1 Tax=Trichonephila clavipes TaxID=2585209 RepID=A0A8X6RAB3_TRICX|nr:uncharacterized protein TNCV_2852841 [Trichonephila clavipes]